MLKYICFEEYLGMTAFVRIAFQIFQAQKKTLLVAVK